MGLTLINLLENIKQNVKNKNVDQLNSHVSIFQEFLKEALNSNSINFNFDDRGRCIEIILSKKPNKESNNQAFIELQEVLKPENRSCSEPTSENNFLTFYLAMQFCESKRIKEMDRTNFGITLFVFFEAIQSEINTKNIRVPIYDLSFLSSQANQTLLGKPPKNLLPPQKYMNSMSLSFWYIDDKKVPYFTAKEKKTI